MGKMKPRSLGVEEIEKEQKKEQKRKASEKKEAKKPVAGEGEEKNSKKIESKEPEKKTANVKNSESKPGKKKIHGSKYKKAKKMVDAEKKYSLVEAISLLKKMKYSAFDESVEIHLNVEKTGLKGEVELPHATGKQIKVAIVNDTVLTELESGKMNFDLLITHPSFMPRLAKYAKVLGPKGLMPNPKAGTISPNPEEVAKKFLKGTLRWKTEAKFPLVHQMVGKLTFDDAKLVENIKVFIEAVGKMHILDAFVASTMTPSVKIDLEKI